MKTAILLISGAIVLWVLLAVSPVKIVLFGKRITFDYGVRKQCGTLTAALALAAVWYGWKSAALPALLLVTGVFLAVEFLFQCHEDENRRPPDKRQMPLPEEGEAAPVRSQRSPNLFHLTLQVLLLADFVLQCFWLGG